MMRSGSVMSWSGTKGRCIIRLTWRMGLGCTERCAGGASHCAFNTGSSAMLLLG